MKKYHYLTSDKQILFLGWYNDYSKAHSDAPNNSVLLEDSDLYRFIEQAKAALNHE